MSCLHYKNKDLYIEQVPLKTIAKKIGTPCYIYSQTSLLENWQTFDKGFDGIPHQICYAVKANSNLAILHLFAKLNSGFDIVSGGELKRVLAAGGDPHKIIFSGVGKTSKEIEEAIHENIYCFNIESEEELKRINDIAEQKQAIINIALRINPDVNPNTHSYISTGLKENKFGIDADNVIPLIEKLTGFPAVRLIGLSCHIGSQITSIDPFLLAADFLIQLYQQLADRDIKLKHLDIGGGLGVAYQKEYPPSVSEYANAIKAKFTNLPIKLILEPGRALVAKAGVLLTQIEYLKHNQHKNFAIVDAGMNDLLRPALYDAWQEILPIHQHEGEKKLYDIVGPVCESSDFLGKDRELSIQAGDLLAIDTSGAYGFSMSSNYNSRCRPAEVLVNGDNIHLIRRRETFEDLIEAEVF